MKKFKIFVDLESEEAWLNLMAMEGYSFNFKGIYYHFSENSTAVNELIKIDYRKFKNQRDFLDYVAMFEDSGWQHISGTKSSGKQYFKCADSKKNTEIFSDNYSIAGKFKRVSDMWLTCATLLFAWFIILSGQGKIHLQELFQPKDWYLTPGLWHLNGTDFIWAFLFETPFALIRGGLGLFFVGTFILSIILSAKYLNTYKKLRTMD